MIDGRDFVISHLYETFHNRPGWLAEVIKLDILDKGELEDLERLAEYRDSVEIEIEKWCRSLPAFYQIDALDSDDEKLSEVMRRLAEIEAALAESWQRNDHYIFRQGIRARSNYKQLCAYREKLLRRVHHKEPVAFRLSESRLEQARQVPLEKLVQPNARGYVNCLWHEDENPSMLVKNGYAWCFACCTWADSIKWIQQERGLSFGEAVSWLTAI